MRGTIKRGFALLGLAGLTLSASLLGTPVTAQVHLRDDGILAGPTASALAFLTKVGLR